MGILVYLFVWAISRAIVVMLGACLIALGLGLRGLAAILRGELRLPIRRSPRNAYGERLPRGVTRVQ